MNNKVLDAIKNGDHEILQKLAEDGADLNAADKENGRWTPAHMAVYDGQVECLKVLAENGANLSGRDRDKKTPTLVALQFTAMMGGKYKECFDFLRQELERRGLDVEKELKGSDPMF